MCTALHERVGEPPHLGGRFCRSHRWSHQVWGSIKSRLHTSTTLTLYVNTDTIPVVYKQSSVSAWTSITWQSCGLGQESLSPICKPPGFLGCDSDRTQWRSIVWAQKWYPSDTPDEYGYVNDDGTKQDGVSPIVCELYLWSLSLCWYESYCYHGLSSPKQADPMKENNMK